jgi:hypothetical protein
LGRGIRWSACVINPMLRLDHIVALLTAARAKIAVILGENGDIDICGGTRA